MCFIQAAVLAVLAANDDALALPPPPAPFPLRRRRLVARFRVFWAGPDWAWNAFDFVGRNAHTHTHTHTI